jgi:hypothetical protein
MGYHARLSPSSADRWSSCTASPAASDGLVDEGSEAARIGTACHQICEECLIDEHADPQVYLDRKMLFWIHPESDSNGEGWADTFGDDRDPNLEFVHEVVVTQAMIDAVVTALNFVRQVHASKGGLLEAEQRVPIGHITGEEDAGGTSDVVILGADWLHTIDFKFGRGKVLAYKVLEPARVDLITAEHLAENVKPNLQLGMYLMGAAEKYSLLGPFKTVTLTVVQPFLSHVSEYTCSFDELMYWQGWLEARANDTRDNPQFVPSVDNCHFCKAKGNCKAQDEFLLTQALEGFDDVTTAAPIPMITDWAAAVTDRVKERLLAGEPVVRSDGLSYKFVAGKKGNREWTDETEAETALKRMRLKPEQMYKTSLQTPTQIEKFSKPPKTKKGEPEQKPLLGPTQWKRVEALIRQSDGAPVIAISTDPRPAIASRTDGFEDVPPADNADLF